MTKKELRKIHLDKRAELSEAVRAEASRIIALTLIEMLRASGCRVVSCFLPIAKFKEIDTNIFLELVRDVMPETILAVPKTDIASGTMMQVVYDKRSQVTENRWGITEPRSGDILPSEMFDAVIVPLLCYDDHGNRVGYGKGFYDRFLAECRSDCRKIGLSYFEPVNAINDMLPTDIKLNAVITPSKMFDFS